MDTYEGELKDYMATLKIRFYQRIAPYNRGNGVIMPLFISKKATCKAGGC